MCRFPGPRRRRPYGVAFPKDRMGQPGARPAQAPATPHGACSRPGPLIDRPFGLGRREKRVTPARRHRATDPAQATRQIESRPRRAAIDGAAIASEQLGRFLLRKPLIPKRLKDLALVVREGPFRRRRAENLAAVGIFSALDFPNGWPPGVSGSCNILPIVFASSKCEVLVLADRNPVHCRGSDVLRYPVLLGNGKQEPPLPGASEY